MKINLYNRDGATMWLEKVNEMEPNISEWKLKVDDDHIYCLKYIRVIGYPSEIEAIDPSGGPFLPLTGELKENDNYYKIIKIINPTTFWLSERDNNN